ncbi:hypothetical protein BpHYR1_049027 [Brachionus plicatilis]|uniref:Uncharacterized protein n=1 Tax=Brachionus plicatilis TaxID=10195 RepID=A0A3M7SGZ7_BRAPC|nr:hypothetical protein BpHYR1_049027 [Brachionus plicatilis]
MRLFACKTTYSNRTSRPADHHLFPVSISINEFGGPFLKILMSFLFKGRQTATTTIKTDLKRKNVFCSNSLADIK